MLCGADVGREAGDRGRTCRALFLGIGARRYHATPGRRDQGMGRQGNASLESLTLLPSAGFFSFEITASLRHPLGAGKTAEKCSQAFLVDCAEARGGPLAPTTKEETPGYEETFLILPAPRCQGGKCWTRGEKLVI